MSLSSSRRSCKNTKPNNNPRARFLHIQLNHSNCNHCNNNNFIVSNCGFDFLRDSAIHTPNYLTPGEKHSPNSPQLLIEILVAFRSSSFSSPPFRLIRSLASIFASRLHALVEPKGLSFGLPLLHFIRSQHPSSDNPKGPLY